MQYPSLYEYDTQRQMTEVFLGYDHNPRIADGAFFDMQNLSSDHYPVLGPRKPRGLYKQAGKPSGMIAKDALCYVDGSDFVINENIIDLGLSDAPKQLVSMGAYVIILPDKKYINTADLSDRGSIEAQWNSGTNETAVTFELCQQDGGSYESVSIGPKAPEEPQNLQYWIDTSATPHSFKQYSEVKKDWVSVATSYVKIRATGIGKQFRQFDAVRISGIQNDALKDLNATCTVWGCGDDYLIVPGLPSKVVTQKPVAPEESEAGVDYGIITVARKMPVMDFVIECSNRLWGCRYGLNSEGDVVNELYCSKLGDFKNWESYMGISTDSWAQKVGTDGPFTGAAAHLGFPLFFKENFLHKVYVSNTGAHQVQDTACRGVQNGCHRSMAIVNEVLFYKARSGVVAYDGSLPTEVSAALGNGSYRDAVGGGCGNKYYVSIVNEQEARELFVFDTAKGLWHKEDGIVPEAFCCCDGELYCLEAGTGRILNMLGSGEPYEKQVAWMAETGDIGLSSPDAKYVTRLTLRLSMTPGATLNIYAQYDGGEWHCIGQLSGHKLSSFTVPIRPMRCDHMRLRLTGRGESKLYGLTKSLEEGSDIP